MSENGSRTNERLSSLVSLIPDKKLLDESAAANMLYDDSCWSRSLSGFFSRELHEFLKCILAWVVESMPRLEWVACLGNEAWFLTCVTLGGAASATRFKEYRDSYKPVVGVVGRKGIAAFPLFHPAARVGVQSLEKGWQAFSASLSSDPRENKRS